MEGGDSGKRDAGKGKIYHRGTEDTEEAKRKSKSPAG